MAHLSFIYVLGNIVFVSNDIANICALCLKYTISQGDVCISPYLSYKTVTILWVTFRIHLHAAIKHSD